LLKRTSAEAIVDQVIARLQELGYLNDEQYAADYSRSRLQVKPLGRRRLKRELTHKQLPEPIVEHALEEAYQETDQETLITQAIEKRLRLRGRPTTRQEVKNLFDHLLRLGFDYELVRQKVSEATRTSALDEEE
jgi:regulatory protein